jgi:hypothetical protein
VRYTSGVTAYRLGDEPLTLEVRWPARRPPREIGESALRDAARAR